MTMAAPWPYFASPSAAAPQATGLAVALELARADGSLGYGFAASAAAMAVAASPLLARKGAALSKAVAVAAVPAAALAYNGLPQRFTAHAISPPASKPAADAPVLTDLRPVWVLFLPQNLFKVLGKNMLIQFAIRFNKYMVETLEHEKQSIAAEQLGEEPPEAPPLPDMRPVLDRGFSHFCREVLVASVRRIYEHLAVWRLSARRAEPFLRDSKAWIRDVLAPRLAVQGARAGRRFYSYQFATLHSAALFYAADCTVAIGYHTYRTVTRKDKGPRDKALIWAKGAGLQVARCFVTLIAVSVGSALGSLAKPGIGTTIGHMGTDAVVSISMSVLIDHLLE